MVTMTIGQVAPLIRRGEVSPVEVTQAALQRIERLEPRLNAFIALRAEEALVAARQAETEIRAGECRGPLHGIPVGVKDNFAVAGWPTTNASKLMLNAVAAADAEVVARLRSAGAIIVGKNNMHEWAMGGTSAYSYFGPVHNPWGFDHVTGGSSGGSAAAVSASMIFAAVGTDAKGSIRIPASYCGTVGFKPTYGLVSRRGELPATGSFSDHVGPLAKDVTDTALLMNVLAGYDSQDPTSCRSEARDYVAGLQGGIAGLRIGVLREFFLDDVMPDVAAPVERAVGQLVRLGAAVEEVRLPSVQYTPLISACFPGQHTNFLRRYVCTHPADFVDPDIRLRVLAAEFVRAADILRCWQLRELMQRELDQVFTQVDVLMTPTTPTTAFPLNVRQVATAPGQVADLNRPGAPVALTTRLTYPFNLLGVPAITLPCGLSPTGLPVGLHLVGPKWRDDLVLRVAYAYEQAAEHGGYTVPPPVDRLAC